MVFTFLKAQGLSTGSSLVEADKVELAKELQAKAKAKGVKLILPTDVILADKYVHLRVCVGVCGDNNRRHSCSNSCFLDMRIRLFVLLCRIHKMFNVCNVLYILISHLRFVADVDVCLCVGSLLMPTQRWPW